MLFALWYVGTILCAFVILFAETYGILSAVEIGFASIAVGSLLGSWAAFLVAALTSLFGVEQLIAAFLILVFMALTRFQAFRDRLASAGSGILWRELRRNWVAVGVALGMGVVFWPMWSSRFLLEETETGRVMSGGSCWADLPFHLHVINAFVHGRNQDVSFSSMHSPVFAGELLTYPHLPDLHAAALHRLGGSLRWSMLLPGFSLFLSLVGLLVCLTRRLTGSRSAAVVAVLVVVCSGGVGALHLFPHLNYDLMALFAKDPIQDDSPHPSGRGDSSVFWFGFLVHVFLPQRGSTFAYPVLLTVLLLVLGTCRPVPPSERSKALLVAAGLCGLLPLVHAHSFIAAGVLVGTLFVLEMHRWVAHPQVLLSWVPAGALAVVLAGPQLMLFVARVHAGAAGGHSFMQLRWIFAGHAAAFPASFPAKLRAALPLEAAKLVVDCAVFWTRALGPTGIVFCVAMLLRLPFILDLVGAALQSALRVAGIRSRPLAATLSLWSPIADLVHDVSQIIAGPQGAAPPSFTSSLDSADQKRQQELQAAREEDRDLSPNHPPSPFPHSSDQTPEKPSITSTLHDTLATADESSTETYGPLTAFKAQVAAFAVLVFANYVVLQPWDKDNTKLFFVWLFVAAAPVAHLYVGPWRAFFSALEPPSTPQTSQTPKKQSIFLPLLLGLVMLLVAFVGAASGLASLVREVVVQNHEIYGPHEKAVAKFFNDNISPKAVTLHPNNHRAPSGMLAGRPSLAAYTGWLWSHGYDFTQRDVDRNAVLNCLTKDSDQHCYDLLRRWGVRYVVSERIAFPDHAVQLEGERLLESKESTKEDAKSKSVSKKKKKSQPKSKGPNFFLENNVERIFHSGPFDIFVVHGYGFPPT